MKTLLNRFLPRRFGRGETGSTMVEFVIVLPLFLLLVLGIIDFGRYNADFVMVKKAMERGARIAAVRPPVCAGVPDTHQRLPVSGGAIPPKFGTACSEGGICANPGTFSCNLDTANATGLEIWNRIQRVMPSTVDAQGVNITYEFDENLGFVGGPYVPSVSLELSGAQFRFITPLGALAALATRSSTPGGAPGGLVSFPDMSVTLTGEDLALGSNG